MFILNIIPTTYTTQQLYSAGQFVPTPFSISSAPMGYNGSGVDFASQNPFWSTNSLDVQNSLMNMGLFPRRSFLSIDDSIGIMTGRANPFMNGNLNLSSSMNSMIGLMDGATTMSAIQPSVGPSILDTARLFMDSPPGPFSGASLLDMSRNFMDSRFSTINSMGPLDFLRSVMYGESPSGLSLNMATSRVASQFFPVMQAVSNGSFLTTA